MMKYITSLLRNYKGRARFISHMKITTRNTSKYAIRNIFLPEKKSKNFEDQIRSFCACGTWVLSSRGWGRGRNDKSLLSKERKFSC